MRWATPPPASSGSSAIGSSRLLSRYPPASIPSARPGVGYTRAARSDRIKTRRYSPAHQDPDRRGRMLARTRASRSDRIKPDSDAFFAPRLRLSRIIAPSELLPCHSEREGGSSTYLATSVAYPHFKLKKGSWLKREGGGARTEPTGISRADRRQTTVTVA